MRLFHFGWLFLCTLSSFAQIHTTLSDSKPYIWRENISFFSYANEWNDFFLFQGQEHEDKVFSLLMADQQGEIQLTSDIRVATQVGDNRFSLAGLALAGRNLTAFVESHNDLLGRNVMAMQAVDNKGGLSSEGMLVGYFDYHDPVDPGEWFIESSPDQKHIALLARLPYRPGHNRRFLYYFMNENLTITEHGGFQAPISNVHDWRIHRFFVSNQGNLYFIAGGAPGKKDTVALRPSEFIYRASVHNDSCLVQKIDLNGSPELFSAGYRAAVDASGDLILMGYQQQKRGTEKRVDTMTTGCWRRSTINNKLMVQGFEAPVKVLHAQHLILEGKQSFLIGQSTENIHVAAMTDEKLLFEEVISRDEGPSMLPAEEGIACGLVGERLFLAFNERAGKVQSFRAVSIDTKKGSLSDIPLRLFKNSAEPINCLPAYFSASRDRLSLLVRSSAGIRVLSFN